ncbi:MAG: saccharopine dehydrogenase NADP-binding domain-containing protein, partial [Christensenellaceae bacterium]|nr:saccharopine dehydrogenase NADP-binding domain-containing protein [Christensenellaceae bacterium]
MSKTLVIGCGGVGSVAIHKCVQNHEVFSDILIASRTKAKCDALAQKLSGGKTRISTAEVNADSVPDLVALMQSYKPDLVLNLALPYQDLSIMEACLI